MAHVEPMDVDGDMENKENSFHHSNVNCTEKGYEELDVSELNMKLRYSTTSGASPMSKSYTTHADRHLEDSQCNKDNLTRSLNSNITNDSVIKSLKSLPLQNITSEQPVGSINSVLRQLESTITGDNNITVTIGVHDDDNLSLESTSSSAIHTPEATTPTNISKEEGSPIIRGLKSVLNMFRSSQSPIPPADNDDSIKQEMSLDYTNKVQKSTTLASTPISAHSSRDGSMSKRSSPLKDSIIFNDDLEKEIEWKEESVLFADDKVPPHKLFPQLKLPLTVATPLQNEQQPTDKLNTTVEYMDISYNNTLMDNTLTEIQNITIAGESDGEFVDCETTFTKNESQNVETNLEPQKDPLSCTFETIDMETINKVVMSDGLLDNNDNEPDITLEVPKDPETTTIIENVSFVESGQNKQSTFDVNKEINDKNALVSYNIVTEDIQGTDDEKMLEVIGDVIINNARINENDQYGKLQQGSSPDTAQAVDTNNTTALEIATGKECGILDIVSAVKLETEPTVNVFSFVDIGNMSHDTEKTSEESDEMSLTMENINIIPIVENIPCRDVDNLTPIRNDSSECGISALANNEEQIANIISGINEVNKSSMDCDEVPKDIWYPDPVSDVSIEPHLSELPLADIAATSVVSPVTENIEHVNSPDIIKPIENVLLETPMNLLTNEAKNIPLPDDDDLDQDLDTSDAVVTLSALPTEVCENVTPKLNIMGALAEPTQTNVITENSQEDKLELKQTLSDKNDSSNETIDIVNSLTEMIGESLNTSQIDMMLQQNLEPMDVSCADEMQSLLPDLVNQTINMPIESDNPPGGSNQIQPFYNEPINNKINDVINDSLGAPDTSFDINEQKKQIDDIKISLPKNTSEESNKYCSTNREQSNDALLKDSGDKPKELLKAESQDFDIINEKEKSNIEDAISEVQLKEIKDNSIIDEELVMSGNNSPYVSVIAETEKEGIEDNCDASVVAEVPSSPPITSRGYNFNFDEMDDPFATKSKIRQSPPTESIEHNSDVLNESKKAVPNRRRSQPPERRRPLSKNKFNATFDANHGTNISYKQNTEVETTSMSVDSEINNSVTIDMNETPTKTDITKNLDSTQVLVKMAKDLNDTCSEKDISLIKPVEMSTENKSSIESITTTSDVKTSSSEQSTYYSAAASSSDSSYSKNVFNLPEIDDASFNPFATKSRMSQSPSFDFENENPFATRNNMRSSLNSSTLFSASEETTNNIATNSDTKDKMDTELMEKDTYNLNNLTSSSKTTDDKNVTSREVNTEDEDTEEGPFLEAEDAIEKLLTFENDMTFNKPTQAVDKNDDGRELFIDAEAFEFLLNKHQGNVVADSGKESLFLKFDPLFSQRISSDGVLAALNKVQKRQSTPTKPIRPSLRNEASPIAGPSDFNTTHEVDMNLTPESNDEANITVAKPMMVVTPAVNPAVSPRNKSITPPGSSRRSVTFTSPAMAVIDRLLSLSRNSSLVGQDTTISHATRECPETDVALKQLQELLAEKEINNYQLRSENKELTDRLSMMESQIKILEMEGQEKLKNINKLNDRLDEMNKINKSMAAVVEEYERTIASLIAGSEQDKKQHAEERNRLISERDEQMAHLASMEASFTDLHCKYEKCKQVILSYKANEEACMKSIKEFEENLIKMQNNYELLKQHATTKLNHANQELQKINKTHESDALKLNAMIKRKDMHITSLEETLAHTTKANKELTAICDELINKVG